MKTLPSTLRSLALIAGLLLGVFGNESCADDLVIQLATAPPGGSRSFLDIMNIPGASDGWDPNDSSFTWAPAPAVAIYSVVSFAPYQLWFDARPPDSYSTICSEIAGSGLSSANSNGLTVYVYNQNYYSNKNIYLDLYDRKGGANTLVGTWDVKQLANSGTTIPITIDNGLSYDANFRFTRIPATLVWSGSTNGVWDVNATANFSGSSSGMYNDGDNVTFDNTGITTNITVASGGVAPGSLVFSNTIGTNYALSGGPIQGATSLVLSGGGQLTLSGTNTYTGGTIVDQGTLIVTNANGLPDGGSLTIGAGGTLIFQGDLGAGGGAVTAVPEPTTLALFGVGVIGLTGYALRKLRRVRACGCRVGSRWKVGSNKATYIMRELMSRTFVTSVKLVMFDYVCGRRNLRKYFLKKVSGLLLVLGLGASISDGLPHADAQDGVLDIYNYVGSVQTNNYLRVIVGPPQYYSVGIDRYDGDIPAFLPETCGLYTVVEGLRLNKDSRPDDVQNQFLMNLFVMDTLSQPESNWLTFGFTGVGGNFNGEPIRLQECDEQGKRFGYQYDIRDVITNHAGILPLADLQPGAYSADTPYKHFILDFQSIPATLIWSGSTNGIWDVNTTANFSGSSSGMYNDGDNVTFDNTGINTTIQIASGGVAPGSIVFSNTTGTNYTVSGGPIQGTTSLVLSGGGQLTLSGTNTYTGGTVVDQGTLIVTNANGLPDGGSLTIGAGATLIFQGDLGAGGASVAPVPEPGTLMLLGVGAIGLFWLEGAETRLRRLCS